ncbi:MAG TPA: hypothetical protein VGO56_02265 [Pyrinomonadaceae bacterium]|nr:hypothetical protein [Pyrinomonadaceae bacterium]
MKQTIRFEIRPELLSWPRECAGYDLDALASSFPKEAAWKPTPTSAARSAASFYELYELRRRNRDR